eukprot:9018397-Lingulodinium_polyedra.AAC.1
MKTIDDRIASLQKDTDAKFAKLESAPEARRNTSAAPSEAGSVWSAGALGRPAPSAATTAG